MSSPPPSRSSGSRRAKERIDMRKLERTRDFGTFKGQTAATASRPINKMAACSMRKTGRSCPA